MKRFLSVLLVFMMIIPTIAVSVSAETATVSFKDVDSATSQGQAIIKLATAGVLLGYPDGTFKPDQPITRGELSKVINKIFNYTEADTEMFSDVDKEKDWYYNDVAIAKKAGYIKGYEDGTFRGENNMTREEACTILKRVGGLYDLGLPAGVTDAVSEWALPYVNAVIIGGFMSLEEGNTFRATEKITRGEFCEAFSKFVQIKEPEVVPPADDKKEEDKKEENKEDNKESGNSGNTTSGNSSSSSSSSSNNSSSDNNNDDEVEEDLPAEDEPIDYIELNAEMVEILNDALADLQNFYSITEYEKNLVGIGIECIDIILPYASTDEITSAFIRQKCKAQIEKADDVLDSMSVDDKIAFYDTVTAPESEGGFKRKTIEYLCNLFGIDFENIKNNES